MPLRHPLALCLAALACASPDAPREPLPNLSALVQLPLLQERTFSRDACEVVEGCALPGDRRLLRFNLSTPNTGTADLVVGDPLVNGVPRPGFVYAPCHDHFHFEGFADYRLLTMDGREVGRGHKQAFCLEDTDHAPSFPLTIVADRDRFTCLRQGIHVGWMDVYLRTLACQYVDVTDVPPGRYRLRATVNVERRIRESRYDDNVGELVVDIPPRVPVVDAGADGGADVPPIDPTLPCAVAEQGVNRDCGWDAERDIRRCAPGARVVLGCDPGCGAPLGQCLGDPMIRVCEGERPCVDAVALASNDDSCPGDAGRNPCARVTFTCPPSGVIRVLTAAYRAGEAHTCRVASP